MIKSIKAAFTACRPYVLGIFCVYVVSSATGILMVHNGNRFALAERDAIVGAAVTTDKAAVNYEAGNHVSAALYDFAGNVFIAALPQAALGLGVIPPFLTAAAQGWIGGIVSVDGEGHSRFTNPRGTAYYFIVLLLQTIGFSLCIGAGVKCGVDAYKDNAAVGWRFWRYRIPLKHFVAFGYVFLLSLPFFLLGSFFEFTSSWNM
jgi:hypothetical protein